MQYTLVSHDGDQYLTVYIPGKAPLLASKSSHTNFDKILTGVLADDAAVVDLFDLAATAKEKFKRLSERVSVKNGRIYLDGDEINNALTQQLLKFIEEDEDFGPLVNFFEKVLSNPNDHSREQLFKFLDHNGMVISIAEDGDIVAYKGMRTRSDDQGTYYVPTHSGHVIVDGEDFPNSDDARQVEGSIVEMPRSEVVHNPGVHCSVGLHIATHSYARTYGNAVLEIRVNPRDVVSVPNDSSEKVRACRYTIVGPVTAPFGSAVRHEPVTLSEEDEHDLALDAPAGTYGEPVSEPQPTGVDADGPFGDGWTKVEDKQPEEGSVVEGWLVEDFEDPTDNLYADEEYVKEYGPRVLTVDWSEPDGDYAEGKDEENGRIWAFDRYKLIDGPDPLVKDLEDIDAAAQQIKDNIQIQHGPGDSVSYAKIGGEMPTVTLDEQQSTPAVVEGRIPTQAEFDDMIALAKKQKKGIKAVAPTRGWKLVADLPKQPASWRIS